MVTLALNINVKRLCLKEIFGSTLWHMNGNKRYWRLLGWEGFSQHELYSS
jgi:hypothetical protein